MHETNPRKSFIIDQNYQFLIQIPVTIREFVNFNSIILIQHIINH